MMKYYWIILILAITLGIYSCESSKSDKKPSEMQVAEKVDLKLNLKKGEKYFLELLKR